jgi:DNA processing protein
MIRPEDIAYPDLLKELDNRPEQLYYIGDVSLLRTTCLAICGSRRCTPYGAKVTRMIAAAAARCGVTVVSGMATGIDSAAHRGALEEGGKTIAVLGCGTDICYPRNNRTLYQEIKEKGLILSEYPDGTGPTHWRFPQRNRIISGISEAVVVTEAALRSGALITAEYATEQSRAVMAVPGNILSNNSAGCNKLILDGAIMITDPCQALRELDINPVDDQEVLPDLGEDEKLVYTIVRRYGSVTMERLYRETLMAPQVVNGIVTLLEIKGLVISSMDGVYMSKFDIDTSSEL